MADAGAAAAAEQTPEQELQAKLKERLEAEFVSAADLSDGCGSKFQCVIISTLFEGKTLLERHRLVNEALKVEMESIHALQMKTWTPEQWEAKGKPEKFE